MTKTMSRRDAIKFGAIAGTATIASGIAGYDIAKAATPAEFPWPFAKFNKKKTQKRGYENYAVKGKGCCYGVFEAIAGPVAEKNGTYDSFPWDAATVGSGGIAHWGTTCGCLNGAAWAVAMLVGEPIRSQVINDLFTWYESEKLPDYKPKKQLKSPDAVKTTKSGSVLCHGSIEAWVNASGDKKGSNEQKERCACLVGSVVGKTVDLLNDVHKNKYKPGEQKGQVAASCLECHDGSVTESAALTNMSCTSCHTDAHNQ